MKTYRSLILFAVLLVSAVPAFADQAAWVTYEEAARALKVLAGHRTVKHFCAPCRDTAVTDETVESIGMFRIAGESYWEVQINGKGVDLAYLYFAKKSDKWVNAAMEAKIDVSDVPKELSRELLGK
jgi:hypothetical protein